MAAKLEKILPSNFELIRDRVGAILKEEIDNQALLYGTGTSPDIIPDPELTCNFGIERTGAVNRDELIEVVIGIQRMGFDNQNAISQRNSITFFVDVYTNAIDKENAPGDYTSAKKLHKLVGIVRAILQSPAYIKLGFANGVIERTTVYDAIFPTKDDDHDSANSRMARVYFKVDAHEEVKTMAPIAAGSYETTVKLGLTEKGYMFIYSNN